MNRNDFDDLARSLSGLPPRRAVVRGLIGAGLGLLAAPLLDGADAGKRRRRKRKRPQVRFNAFGCVDVGAFCQSDDQCCSNLCREQSCRAHDTGGCAPGFQDRSCSDAGTNVECTTSGGNPGGRCNTTTGNGAFCTASGGCYPCTKDVECEAVQGPGAACILCAKCPETGGTSCASAKA
jgi:hypothetical protein